MGSTSFTSSEWREFENGVGPEEAWPIACKIWNEERRKKLDEYKEFLEHIDEGKRNEALDLLGALYSLYTGNTKVYHELMDRLRKLVYELGYEPIVYETSHAELLRGR